MNKDRLKKSRLRLITNPSPEKVNAFLATLRGENVLRGMIDGGAVCLWPEGDGTHNQVARWLGASPTAYFTIERGHHGLLAFPSRWTGDTKASDEALRSNPVLNRFVTWDDQPQPDPSKGDQKPVYANKRPYAPPGVKWWAPTSENLVENKSLTTGLKRFLTHAFSTVREDNVLGWRVYYWDRDAERENVPGKATLAQWLQQRLESKAGKNDVVNHVANVVNNYTLLEPRLKSYSQLMGYHTIDKDKAGQVSEALARMIDNDRRFLPTARAFIRKCQTLKLQTKKMLEIEARGFLKKLVDKVSEAEPQLYLVLFDACKDALIKAASLDLEKAAIDGVREVVQTNAQVFADNLKPWMIEDISQKLKYAAGDFLTYCSQEYFREFNKSHDYPKLNKNVIRNRELATQIVEKIFTKVNVVDSLAFDLKNKISLTQAFRELLTPHFQDMLATLADESTDKEDWQDASPGFYAYCRQAKQAAHTAVGALQAIGIRRNLRCPIVFFYQGEKEPSGYGSTYAAGKFYTRQGRNAAVIYGNTIDDQTIDVIVHEIGHKVYAMLPLAQQAFVMSLANTTPLLTNYSNPSYVYKGTTQPHLNHTSGNEWLAEMLMLLVRNPQAFNRNTILPTKQAQYSYDKPEEVNSVAEAFKQIKVVLGGY
jgi:hypothetical protein